MWDDPSGGDTMPVSFKTSTDAGDLTAYLGDWRDSCVGITEHYNEGK